MHEADHVAITYADRLAIGHRHGKACAAEQVASRTHVDLWVNMLAGAVAFTRQQRGLEPGQAARAAEGCEHESIGP